MDHRCAFGRSSEHFREVKRPSFQGPMQGRGQPPAPLFRGNDETCTGYALLDAARNCIRRYGDDEDVTQQGHGSHLFQR